MESLSQKINLLSLELQGSQDVSFFVYLIFLHCWTIPVVWLMTFRMCKILLKSPQMCRC